MAMFKKHMTPLAPHTKKGSLHNSVNKASSVRDSAGAMGGMQNFGSYAKATPMADDEDQSGLGALSGLMSSGS